MTNAPKQLRHATARPLALTAAAALLAVSFAQQAHAAAKAPDVDPSRYSMGNIVYPPGAKPAPGTETLQNGEVVTEKSTHAVTIQPESKGKAKHKSAE